MSELPPYVHFPGNPIATPPCLMSDVNLYGFFLEGDLAVIQKFIDQTLNANATESVRFKALSKYTLLSFANIGSITSLAPEYKNEGWLPERDVVIWLPVAKMVKKGDDEKIDYIYWYPAFISVDNIYAILNGREIWGYNKYLCECDMPSDGSVPETLSVSLQGFQPYSPDTKMASHELLTVTKINDGHENPFEEFVDFVKEVFELLRSGHDFFDLDINALKQMMSGFIDPKMDQILFKQFPDGDGNKALYQKVMSSPSDIKKIHTAKIYTHEFEVKVNPFASFPLTEMFGIPEGISHPILPFMISMDFEQEAATEIDMDKE